MKENLEKLQKKIIKTWSKNVGVDIVKQIKDFSKDLVSSDQKQNISPYQFVEN